MLSILGCYILQRKYKCGSCEDIRSALKIISHAKGLPDFVRNSYPIIHAGSTYLMRDLAHYILNDVVTAKTVDEISVGIKKTRYTEYTRLLSSYYSIVNYRSGTTSASTKFSSFEDKQCFNDLNYYYVEDKYNTIVLFMTF